MQDEELSDGRGVNVAHVLRLNRNLRRMQAHRDRITNDHPLRALPTCGSASLERQQETHVGRMAFRAQIAIAAHMTVFLVFVFGEYSVRGRELDGSAVVTLLLSLMYQCLMAYGLGATWSLRQERVAMFLGTAIVSVGIGVMIMVTLVWDLADKATLAHIWYIMMLMILLITLTGAIMRTFHLRHFLILQLRIDRIQIELDEIGRRVHTRGRRGDRRRNAAPPPIPEQVIFVTESESADAGKSASSPRPATLLRRNDSMAGTTAAPASPNPAPTPASLGTPAPLSESSEDECVVCFDGPQDAMLLDCGHKLLCINCARRVRTCPICRADIATIVHYRKRTRKEKRLAEQAARKADRTSSSSSSDGRGKAKRKGKRGKREKHKGKGGEKRDKGKKQKHKKSKKSKKDKKDKKDKKSKQKSKRRTRTPTTEIVPQPAAMHVDSSRHVGGRAPSTSTSCGQGDNDEMLSTMSAYSRSSSSDQPNTWATPVNAHVAQRARASISLSSSYDDSPIPVARGPVFDASTVSATSSSF